MAPIATLRSQAFPINCGHPFKAALTCHGSDNCYYSEAFKPLKKCDVESISSKFSCQQSQKYVFLNVSHWLYYSIADMVNFSNHSNSLAHLNPNT